MTTSTNSKQSSKANGNSTPNEDLDKAIKALRSISLLGGNLSDEALTSRTGPNDAVSRGIMYTGARNVALECLKGLGVKIED